MFRVRSAGSQSLKERASCSQGNGQAVFIFDTISKRSEMITTNGRVNNPSVVKGICPKAGNCCHTQLPIPDCSPDGVRGSVVCWRWPGRAHGGLVRDNQDTVRGSPGSEGPSHPSWGLVSLVWVAHERVEQCLIHLSTE